MLHYIFVIVIQNKVIFLGGNRAGIQKHLIYVDDDDGQNGGKSFFRVGHLFFSKERNILAFFSVLHKRTE